MVLYSLLCVQDTQTVRLRELRIDRTQTIKLQTPFYCQGLYVYSLWLIVATVLFMLPGFEAINVRLWLRHAEEGGMAGPLVVKSDPKVFERDCGA